jgi:hypothetical protein
MDGRKVPKEQESDGLKASFNIVLAHRHTIKLQTLLLNSIYP